MCGSLMVGRNSNCIKCESPYYTSWISIIFALTLACEIGVGFTYLAKQIHVALGLVTAIIFWRIIFNYLSMFMVRIPSFFILLVISILFLAPTYNENPYLEYSLDSLFDWAHFGMVMASLLYATYKIIFIKQHVQDRISKKRYYLSKAENAYNNSKCSFFGRFFGSPVGRYSTD